MSKENPQMKLALIERHVGVDVIEQRITDGYIHATNLCKAAGKELKHYLENKSTKEFLIELSMSVGIPTDSLIEIIKTGNNALRGTWVHPQVAINLAQWASPKFAVKISKWVFEWLNGNVPNKNRLPYHIQRYITNRSEIPVTHFSVLNELFVLLIAPLEAEGYELPDSLVPDISEGRMFADWMRKENGIDTNDLPTYTHTYPDGRQIPGARLYPNKYLEAFRQHFNEVWLKSKARKYFEKRDLNALPYLESVYRALPQSVVPAKNMIIENDAERRAAILDATREERAEARAEAREDREY